ncbi:hypothetical protein ACWEKT_35265 [Nocardia takedensis]
MGTIEEDGTPANPVNSLIAVWLSSGASRDSPRRANCLRAREQSEDLCSP